MERVKELLLSMRDACDKLSSNIWELCTLNEKLECDLMKSRLQLHDHKVVNAQSTLDLENVRFCSKKPIQVLMVRMHNLLALNYKSVR